MVLHWQGDSRRGHEWVEARVEGLGVVVIHRAEGGLAVDINGKRAWSACRDGLTGVQLWVTAKLDAWRKINEYIQP